MKQLLILLVCLSFVGCSNVLKEGDVVEKWHEPESVYTMLMPMTISDGKTTTTYMIPYIIQDNEDWVVKIKGTYKGEIKTEKVYVSPQQYQCLNIGSHLTIGKDCSLSDNNNIETEKK